MGRPIPVFGFALAAYRYTAQTTASQTLKYSPSLIAKATSLPDAAPYAVISTHPNRHGTDPLGLGARCAAFRRELALTQSLLSETAALIERLDEWVTAVGVDRAEGRRAKIEPVLDAPAGNRAHRSAAAPHCPCEGAPL